MSFGLSFIVSYMIHDILNFYMKVMYILVKAKSKKQIKRKNEYNVEANEYVKQIRNVLTWATLGIYCFLL